MRIISFIKDQEVIKDSQQKSQLKTSMETRVESPLMTIESFNRQFQPGEKEREAVKWGWEQEMRKTMFHVVNEYTRAAQFEGLPAEGSYRLQKAGGIRIIPGRDSLHISTHGRATNINSLRAHILFS